MDSRLYRISALGGQLLVSEYHAKECDKIFKVSRDKLNWEHVSKDRIDEIKINAGSLEIWSSADNLEKNIKKLREKRSSSITEKIRELQDERRKLNRATAKVSPAYDATTVSTKPVTDDMF
jgi:septal ring factor EnvC (AmiA/AmiB activator)